MIPAIITALIGAHMGLLVRQKHTEFPAAGKTEETVSGERLYPLYAAKAGGFFFIVFGVIAALGGLAQINPISLGPRQPGSSPAGSQPDWWHGHVDGSTRLFPSWDIHLGNYTIPAGVLAHGSTALHLDRAGSGLPIHRSEDDEGHRAPQPAAASA